MAGERRPGEPDRPRAGRPAERDLEGTLASTTPRVESTLLNLRASRAPAPAPERRVESTLLDLRGAAPTPRLDETRASPSRAGMTTPRPLPPGPALETLLSARSPAGGAGEPPPEPGEEAPPPPRIGRFLVLRQLGRGGMGVVYAAYDDHLDRKVAIKLLRDQGAEGADDRLLREAQALARLSHPNVVGVYEVGRALGSIYIAMEYVTGVTLREWLADRRRSTAEILGVFLQAGRGLEAAHAVGLIHRDFKPDNVMVGDDGRARVFDFGLARSVIDEAAPAPTAAREAGRPLRSGSFLRTDMTIAGTILGTPAYMAPEQFRAGPTDARTDVFSFCVALHEALYDRRPFAGATFDELMAAVCGGALAPVPAGAPVPGWLRARLLRGLEADPERRWQRLADLLDALADDPVARRRRWLRAGALVALVAAIAVATPLAIGALRARWHEQAREEAAARRWEAIAARLEALDAAGRRGEADAVFDAFAGAAEVRGTRALTEAWLTRGRRFYGDGDDARAMEAFAAAYTGAPTPALERGTLLAMAEVFRGRWDMRSLSPLVRFLSAGEGADAAAVDPAIDALRVDVALHRRDFTAAADLLDRLGDAAPAHLRGLPPALRRLARATDLGPYEGHPPGLVDLGDGGPGQLLLRPFITLEGPTRPTRLALQGLQGGPARPLDAAPMSGTRLVDGGPFVFFARPEAPALWRLCEVTPAGLTERWRGALPSPPLRAIAGDLDGDGRTEVYVALAAYRRGLFRVDVPAEGPPATAEPAIVDPTIDALGSDVLALALADVDGDDRPELVVGLGPWRGYDLRILRRAGAGFETLAHAELGAIQAIGALRRADGGRWIVAVTDDVYPNRVLFPAPPHLGEAAGAHLLRWQGGRLERGPTIPAPPAGDGQARMIPAIHVADVDGDGREDALMTQVEGRDGARVFLSRQGPDGAFTPVSLGEGALVGLAQVDDDPEAEVILDVDRHLWLLGQGPSDTPIAPAEATPPPPAAPPLGDPALVAHWERADRLAAVGLEAIAARSLERLAALLDGAADRAPVLERASDLFARAGERARAIEVLGAIEGDPARVAAARRRAASHHAALGDFLAAADALGEVGDEGADPAAFAPFTLAELARLRDPGRRSTIAFDRPLDPAWEFPRPAVARRDHVAGRLVVEASHGGQPWARLPVVADGGPILVRITLEVRAIEYAGYLRVELHDAAGEVAEATLSVIGGAGHLIRDLGGAGRPLGGLGESLAEAPVRLTITHALSPATGQQATILRAGGDGPLAARADPPLAGDRANSPLAGEVHLRGDRATPRPLAGPLSLVLAGPLAAGGNPGQVRLAVDAVELVGLRPAAAVEDPAVRGRNRLVEGQTAEAAALLAAAPREALGDRLALALALAEEERWGEARAALAPVAAPDEAGLLEIAESLRARPALLPVVTEVLGAARVLEARVLGWGVSAAQHEREPFARRALLGDFADLRAYAPDDPDTRRFALQLLLARAAALRGLGDLEEARADLDAALAAALAPGSVATPHAVAGLHREQARLLVEGGDLPGARAALARALALAVDPDLERARLRRDPTLQGALDDAP